MASFLANASSSNSGSVSSISIASLTSSSMGEGPKGLSIVIVICECEEAVSGVLGLSASDAEVDPPSRQSSSSSSSDEEERMAGGSSCSSRVSGLPHPLTLRVGFGWGELRREVRGGVGNPSAEVAGAGGREVVQPFVFGFDFDLAESGESKEYEYERCGSGVRSSKDEADAPDDDGVERVDMRYRLFLCPAPGRGEGVRYEDRGRVVLSFWTGARVSRRRAAMSARTALNSSSSDSDPDHPVLSRSALIRDRVDNRRCMNERRLGLSVQMSLERDEMIPLRTAASCRGVW